MSDTFSSASLDRTVDAFDPTRAGYALSDELARLCLPHEFKDSCRNLAWANSICFLFLVIGLIGLKAPRVFERPLSAVVENAPVVFTPPPEQQKPPEPKPADQQPPPDDSAAEAPQIAPVVAVMPSANIKFAVPVEGVQLVTKDIRVATPPPPVNRPAPPTIRTFVPGQGEGGSFPWPGPRDYPSDALAQRAQGTVMLYVVVDAAGVPEKVEVKDSSGFHVLDQFSSQWLKKRWRWLAGETRYYYVPFVFKLQ